MDEITIFTRYPEVAKAAANQNIPLDKVFGKLEVAGSGLKASYPLVKVTKGIIPLTHDGSVIYDSVRISYAKTLSKLHQEDDVVSTIKSLTA